MKRRTTRFNKLGILAGVAFASAFFGAAVANTPESNAAPITDFKAGNIIDDAVFYNKDTMTVSQIQAHLNKYMPACDTWGTGAIGSGRSINGKAVPANTTRAEYARMKREAGDSRYHEPPYVCVQNYYENPETHRSLYDSENKIEDGMISAAQIIYNAAQQYKINPQVLLVLLKKESYVWGDNWPLKWEYDTVMGYGCPDNAPCDTQYYGFYNQITKAAWQLNYYREHIYSYNYRPYATNQILYSPTASCGRKSVYLENIATTSLYIYTPYTPNDEALKAYPGTATCGSYGNRNFYMYFKEWFGDTHNINATKTTLQSGKYYLYDNATVFEATKNSDGTYYFKNSKTGLMLAASTEAVNVDTTVVEAAANTATKAQKWYVYALGNGQYNLASAANPSFVISFSNNQMMLNTYGSADAKAMKILPVNESGIADGDYRLPSMANKNFLLDLNKNENKNGANVQLWQSNGSPAQIFSISFDKTSGFYKITHKSTGKVLDVSGGTMANGSNVQVWESNNTCAQRWAIYKTSAGYEIYSSCNLGYALNLNGNSASNGVNVNILNTVNNNTQRWAIESAQQAATPQGFVPTQSRPIEDGNYVIGSSLRNNFVIDVQYGIARNLTNLWMYDKNNTAAQTFKVVYDSYNDAYSFKSALGNFYMDLSGAATRNSSNIHTYNPNGSCAQFWKLSKNSDNSYTITSKCNAKFALDVQYGSKNNGANLQLYESNGTAAQKWIFTKK